jgi:hypothetical protein
MSDLCNVLFFLLATSQLVLNDIHGAAADMQHALELQPHDKAITGAQAEQDAAA